MNIVEINQTYKSGSTGNIVQSLVKQVNDIGGESLICCAEKIKSDNLDYASMYRIGSVGSHKLHAILSRITGKQSYFSYYDTKQLIKQLKKFKPDLIHLHNLHGNYINLKLLFKYIQDEKVPTVLTLHDCWFFTGKCATIRDCEKWKNGCGQCPYLYIDRVNPSWFFDRTNKCLRDKEKWFSQIENLYVVGVSQWILNCSRNSILREAKHERIYNGVNTEIFRPIENDLRKKYLCEDKFVIVMVSSNISETKGYKELLYLSTLNKEDFQVILIGKNINNLIIPRNVLHIQYVANQTELARFYSAADVCVNTTMFETFGLVTAEAMACGTPVIVYNNTASPELVDSACGIVIEPDDKFENLRNAIYCIKTNSKSYYSDNCRKYVKNMFSNVSMVSSYINLYQKIIEEKKSANKKNKSY